MNNALDTVQIALVAVCLDCRLRHQVHATPETFLVEMGAWEGKHRGHRIEFRSPKRRLPRRLPRWLERWWGDAGQEPWWMAFGENADLKPTYVASAAYTCTLASLATSATWVAGRETTAVSNISAGNSGIMLGMLIAGVITVGTTPTTNTTIEVWAYGSYNDTPSYPDAITGTDGARTLNSVGIKQSGLRLIAAIAVDSNTSNRPYPFGPISSEAIWGALLPRQHGLWITHNTGVNLNATGGNHVLSYTGGYLTSAG